MAIFKRYFMPIADDIVLDGIGYTLLLFFFAEH